MGGGTEGGSVGGRWSLVTNVEYLEPWVYDILRSSDSIGTLGSSETAVRAFLRVVWYFC